MSKVRAEQYSDKAGSGAPTFTNGVNVTGTCTATAFVGDVTGTSTGLPGTPDITIRNLNGVGATFTGAVSIAGSLTVSGTETVVNTTELHITDKTVGIASTSNPSNTTADGAGIQIYGGSDGDKSLYWERDTGCFEFSTPVKFKGVTETVSTATTSVNIAQGAFPNCVLHCDCSGGTVFEYQYAHQNVQIGIVSFTNIPTDTGVANGVPITVFFQQHASGPTAGYGNTGGADGRAGIETCTVVGYEDGSAVSGITTHVITGSGTTMKNTYGSGNYDVQTFYISYNGSSNTTNTSYKIYGSSNSDYKFPRAYQ